MARLVSVVDTGHSLFWKVLEVLPFLTKEMMKASIVYFYS